MTGKAELMFEVLSDGVIFFDTTGSPRFVNRVARDQFGGRAGTVFTDVNVQRMLAELRAGRAQFPLEVRTEFVREGKVHPLIVSILDWKSGGGYVFAIREDKVAFSEQNNLGIVFEMIRRELANPIENFIKAAESAVSVDPNLRAAGDSVLDRLSKVVEVAQVFGDEEIVGNDRVQMREVFDESWPEIAPLAAPRFVRISMNGFTGDLPPVYGSRKWLKRALAEIMHNAIKHALPGRDAQDLSVVDIEATFDGRWLNLRVTNLGLGVNRELGSRVFIPFARARMPANPSMKGLGLGLPIAQRIVELHGGQIKVEQTTDNRIEVLLMLPTGVAPRTDPRLDIQQAQRYARDLAKVLARRTKRQPQPA